MSVGSAVSASSFLTAANVRCGARVLSRKHFHKVFGSRPVSSLSPADRVSVGKLIVKVIGSNRGMEPETVRGRGLSFKRQHVRKECPVVTKRLPKLTDSYRL